MSNQTAEQFEAIVKKFRESTLDKCSENELRQYHTFLLEHGAVGGFNETTYNRMCDHINSLLMHQETQKKLEELKKPHWTVLPIFGLAFVSASAAVIGIFISLNSKPQIAVSTNPEPEKTTATSAPKKPEPQQNILKPISSSAASRGQGSRR